MTDQDNRKAGVSISCMASQCGLSRSRFDQLIGTAFPYPIYDVATRRPFYPPDLQEQCLEVRRRNFGINGILVRPDSRSKRMPTVGFSWLSRPASTSNTCGPQARQHPRRPDARNLRGRPRASAADHPRRRRHPGSVKGPPGPAGSFWTGTKGPSQHWRCHRPPGLEVAHYTHGDPQTMILGRPAPSTPEARRHQGQRHPRRQAPGHQVG
jgi:hypothetical protein